MVQIVKVCNFRDVHSVGIAQGFILYLALVPRHVERVEVCTAVFVQGFIKIVHVRDSVFRKCILFLS